MGSSKIKSRILELFLCLIFVSCGIHAKELRKLVGCGDGTIYLYCGNLSVIALYEARFDYEGAGENVTCPPGNVTELPENNTCQEDLRISINRRCSGLKQCNFTYTDEVSKKCNSSQGVITIQYDCVRESSIHKFCNVELKSIREGYITSPGYPMYYPDLSSCKWTIEAADGQNIFIRLLHVHMRFHTYHHHEEYPVAFPPPTHPEDFTCDDDILRIWEGSSKKLTVCGENLESLTSLRLNAKNGVTVDFSSTKFFPGSGFLLYFQVQGCPTPGEPENGKLVLLTESTAHYLCSEDRLFNDTLMRERTLVCNPYRLRWNDTLPACVEVQELQQIYVNKSFDFDFENMTNDEGFFPFFVMSRTFIEDTLIPVVLMAVLIIGNTVIVTIIFIVRRRSKAKLENEDEILNLEEETSPQAANV